MSSNHLPNCSSLTTLRSAHGQPIKMTADPYNELIDEEVDNVESRNTAGHAFEDQETEDEPTVIGAFQPMLFSTSTRRVRDLNSDYTNQELDPRPSFQRGYVWDLAKASRLIESVLLNVPLPLIYTAEESDSNKEVVIDGQQRLLTLFGYIKGQFPRNGRPFRLKQNTERPEWQTLQRLGRSIPHKNTEIRHDNNKDWILVGSQC
jgi:hypothetical protein